MNKYYELLGLHLDDVKKHFEKNDINYKVTILQGRKDKDKLIYPRIIKITQLEDQIELFVTYFSGSLI